MTGIADVPAPRVLVVVCHPRPDSFTRAVSGGLADRARAAGCVVTVHDLDADGFDPRLTAAESMQVKLGEPGPAGDALTSRYREDLAGADVLVAVHPNWWGKPPALMSGWLDRVLAPGVAYKLQGGASGAPRPALSLDALVVTLGDTPEDRERDVFGDPLDAVWTRCVLPYVGARAIERRHLTPVGAMTGAQRGEALAGCLTVLDRLLSSAGSAAVGPGPQR